MTTRQYITIHEGREYMPYKCPAGRWTIGVGHNYQDNPLPHDIDLYLRQNGKILDEHIDRLLAIDIIRAVSDCKKIFSNWDALSPDRKMALTDMCFQLGGAGLRKFKKMILCIEHEAWDDAARQILNSLYATQTPQRARENAELIKGEIK